MNACITVTVHFYVHLEPQLYDTCSKTTRNDFRVYYCNCIADMHDSW